MVSLSGFDPQFEVYVEKAVSEASAPLSFVYAARSLFKSSLGKKDNRKTLFASPQVQLRSILCITMLNLHGCVHQLRVDRRNI